MAEPIQKQRVSFPLFLGRDGGSDPKAVRNNLLEAKNVWHEPEGVLSKRPGLWKTQAVTTDLPLVAADTDAAVMAGSFADVNAPTTVYGNLFTEQHADLVWCGLEGRRLGPIRDLSYHKGVTWGPRTNPVVNHWPAQTAPLVDLEIRVRGHNPFTAADSDLVQRISLDSKREVDVLTNKLGAALVYSAAGGWHYSGTTVYTPYAAPYNTLAVGSTVRAIDVLEFTEGGNTFTVLGLMKGTYVLDFHLFVNGTFQDLASFGLALTSITTPHFVLGLYHSVENSEIRVVCQDNATPSNLYEYVVDYTTTTITTTGSIASEVDLTSTLFSGTTVGAMRSFARTRVQAATDSGFIATFAGAATDAFDYMWMYYPSVVSEHLRKVPKASEFVCHGFDLDGDSTRRGVVLFVGDSTDKVTVGGSPTVGGYPTAVRSYVVCRVGDNLTNGVTLGPQVFPAEGHIRTNDGWQPLSDPWTHNSKLYIPVVIGGGILSIGYIEITPAASVYGWIPTVQYDNSYLAALPQVAHCPSGASLYHPALHQGLELAEQASGSLETTGTYQYLMVPVFRAGDGRIIYGTPSDPVAITLTGSNTGVVVTRREEIHRSTEFYRDSRLFQIYLFRTTDGGATFRYLAPILGTYTDTTSDATLIASGDVLYYQSSGLYAYGHDAPPPARDLWVHDNRLWIIPADDPSVLWFSRKRPELDRALTLPAGEGPSFSAVDTIDFGPGAQPLRGTSFGGAMVVFTKAGVSVLGGEGPDSAGSGSFASPQQLALPALAEAPAMINLGEHIVYKTTSSWALVDRGFNVTDIGGPIDDLYDTAVRSIVRRSATVIQVLLSDGVTSLVFDTVLRQWFKWSYALNGATLDRAVEVEGWDSIVAQAGTQLYGERIAAQTWPLFRDINSSDANGEYTMLVETRWFNVDSFAGFQRLYEIGVLGQYKSPHDFKVTIYYDYNESDFETSTVTVSSNPGTYLFRWQPSKQVNRAFKIRIEEVNPSGTEESFTLTGLDAIIGVKPRTHFESTEYIG